MIPRVSKGGASFGDAVGYYAHDKAAKGMAATSERVEWVETRNLPIDTTRGDKAEQIEAMKKCAIIQQWTADHQRDIKIAAGGSSAGRPLQKPVYTYSLSWAPHEDPSRAEMLKAAHESLKILDMQNCQVMIVAHNDTHMSHLHCIVNRVDPKHGRAAVTNCDRLKLSKWAEAYERKRGAILVQDRVKANAMRDAQRTGDKSANFDKQASGRAKGNFVKAESLTREERRSISRYSGMIAYEINAGTPFKDLGHSIRAQRRAQQLADKDQLDGRLNRRQASIEADLKRDYGDRRKALADDLAATEARVGAKGWFRRAIRRVTGHQQRDQAAAIALKKSIANLDKRMEEARSAKHQSITSDRLKLDARHAAELARDERLISEAKAKVKSRSDERARAAKREADRKAATAKQSKTEAKTKTTTKSRSKPNAPTEEKTTEAKSGRGTRGQNRTEGRTRDRSEERAEKRRAERAEALVKLSRDSAKRKDRDRGLGD